MKRVIIILSIIASSIILIFALLFAFTISNDNKCIPKIVMMNYSEEPNLEQLFSWYNLKEQDIEYYQKGYDESTCHFGPGGSTAFYEKLVLRDTHEWDPINEIDCNELSIKYPQSIGINNFWINSGGELDQFTCYEDMNLLRKDNTLYMYWINVY